MIVGFTGLAGSGKSTAASYLVTRGFVRTRFAGPLKAMVRAYLNAVGVDPAEIEAMVEGALKEAPHPAWSGRSTRHVMQTLGTEWGRETIDPNLWTNAWRLSAERAENSIVVDDCRFTNEAAAIRAAGGFVVRISRPGQTVIETSAHASERQPIEADATLWNDGDIGLLHERLAGMIARQSASAAP